MIPAAFDYRRAHSLAEALELLAEYGDDAKVLAGGHSLIPLLRLRFARPELLVDVSSLRELSYVEERDEHVAIGALTRYCELQRSATLGARVPLLGAVVERIGDPQVRHRGTIGGSVCHGDSAADLPAALVALDASFAVVGPDGERTVAAEDFFVGFLETALGPDELLREIRIPLGRGAGSFEKFSRRSQDWAIVGCSVSTGESWRIALVNMGTVPVRARQAEAALESGATAAEAAALADAETEPQSDQNGSAQYRRHLARVLVGRAIEAATR